MRCYPRLGGNRLQTTTTLVERRGIRQSQNLPERIAVDPNVTTPRTVATFRRSNDLATNAISVSLAEAFATARSKHHRPQGANDSPGFVRGHGWQLGCHSRVVARSRHRRRCSKSHNRIWHFVSSLAWNTTDRPVGTAGSIPDGNTGTKPSRTDAAEFKLLLKPLPSGGIASITFDTHVNSPTWLRASALRTAFAAIPV